MGFVVSPPVSFIPRIVAGSLSLWASLYSMCSRGPEEEHTEMMTMMRLVFLRCHLHRMRGT